MGEDGSEIRGKGRRGHVVCYLINILGFRDEDEEVIVF